MSRKHANQPGLLEVPPAWSEKWQGMPEFDQPNQMPWQSIKVHFRNAEDRQAFADLIGQPVYSRTKCVWFPKAEIGRIADKRYRARSEVLPQYPVYVISKGRWKFRHTAKALEAMRVPYRIVVEPQEFDLYAEHIPAVKILTLPFSNLGQGSIPARNWVWEHAVSEGAERHWILDDNIYAFFRLNRNLRVKCETGATFRAAEEFTDRYENVGLSGFNYKMFAKRKDDIPPYVLNTRIYSCILIRNDIPFRWRGRYNEDTDLSLRVLKSGLCTILFNAFLADKATTMTTKGGNTDELYQDDGRLKMAESLAEQHPDLVKITEKWGRPQHSVNYHVFRHNRLKRKPGVEPSEGVDDFGMSLEFIAPNGNGHEPVCDGLFAEAQL